MCMWFCSHSFGAPLWSSKFCVRKLSVRFCLFHRKSRVVGGHVNIGFSPEPLESWPTTFHASKKHLLWCGLFLILGGTKIGGMWSFTVDKQKRAVIYGTNYTMMQTPLREIIIGMEETSVILNFAALWLALMKRRWRFIFLENEQLESCVNQACSLTHYRFLETVW